MLAEPRYVSIERARIITNRYKASEGQHRCIQRALALKAALSEVEIRITPEELIVGNRTAGVRGSAVFPETGASWIDREFESLPTRPQVAFTSIRRIFGNFAEKFFLIGRGGPWRIVSALS